MTSISEKEKKILKFLILFFVLLGVGTLISARFVPAYLEDGPELLHDSAFSSGGKYWKIHKPEGTGVRRSPSGVTLFSRESVSVILKQEFDSLPVGMKFRVEAEAMSSELEPGEKKWHRPSIDFIQYDINGKRLKTYSEAVAINRPDKWRDYSKIFTIHPDTVRVKISVAMIRCKGDFSVKNLSFKKVRKNPLFIYFQLPVLVLWALFLVMVFYSLAGSRARLSVYVLLMLLSIIILAGTTIPGNTRQMLKDAVEGPLADLTIQQTAVKSLKAGTLGRFYDSYSAGIAHFSFFFLWGFLFFHIVKKRNFSLRMLIVYMSFFAGSSELMQFFAEERGPHIFDFMIDLSGCGAGYLLACSVSRAFLKTRQEVIVALSP